MEWIEKHPELAVAILGPLFLATGYLIRVRAERHQNLREALYLLLELWHRVSILTYRTPEEVVDTFVSRLRVRVPNAVMSEGEVAATKAYFSPVLGRLLRSHALADFEGLQAAYVKVIGLVARTHPVYAYELEASSKTQKRLTFLDEYLDAAYSPLEQQGGVAAALTARLRRHVVSHVERDSATELEHALRGLAFRVGVLTSFQVHLLIRKRHRRMKESTASEIDELIDSVLKPVMSDPTVAALFPVQQDSTPPLESAAQRKR